jgi:hypothetical protein
MFFADLNHDGYIDLVSGGIFLNNGDGTFGPDVSSQLGVISEGRGGIAFDADGDGDLDFILNRSDRDAPYLRYYRNDLTSGTWLKVKLAAPNGQLGAPGAKVWVYERGHLGEPDYLLGYREVVTATGFVSGPSATQHFGLGGQTSVDVRARFITGEVEERIGVPANTTLQMEGTQPPVISNVASTNVTSSGSTITWVTDEPADSQVEYGLTTAYGITTPLDTTLTQDHSVTLSGLNANTTYHYRVKSKDAAGNLAESGDYSFTTAPTPDTQPPLISNVASGNITSSGATITWSTNEPADSQVEYGLTTRYGTLTPLDATITQTHSLRLSGLQPKRTYYYRVRSKDAAGNLTISKRYSFKTKADVDLIADELWWSPDPVIEGNSVIIGFRVKNVGSQSAGPFHLQIKRDGTTICTWAVFGLGPNRVFERGPGLGGAACSGIYGIPAAQTPGYNISFMVDDLNQVGETDEGNNTITKYMVVRE